MSKLEDIPEMAICPKCGKPMQVVDLVSQAARLGVRMPAQGVVIECCGQEFFKRLASDLMARFGRGFSDRSLYKMRLFYLSHTDISPTLSAKSSFQISPTLSAKSSDQNSRLSVSVISLGLPTSF